MIILGRKHKFTNLEIEELKKKHIFLNIIVYRNRDPKEVLDELKIAIQNDKNQTIVLNTKAKVSDEIIKFLTNLHFQKGVKFISTEYFLETYLQKCFIPSTHTDLNFLCDIKPYNTFSYMQKRFVDYLGSILLFLLTWPVMIYSKTKIDKQSPGGAIFCQERVGKDKKIFTCYKFRSMKLDAEKDGARYASKDDKRVFEYGSFMRKTRIDELPQLLNVLKGNMHLIGPRPEWEVFESEYENVIPYYNERHLVRPGITGWAQVKYPYGANAEDARQKLMYDLYYIKHWSLWLEFKIVFHTIFVILGKKGQ